MSELGVSGSKAVREGAGIVPNLHAFHPKKAHFLELAEQWWPDVSRVCKAVGVDYKTVWNHRKSDPEFEAALKAIDAAYCDALERTMLELGSKASPATFNDRIAYLRAHRGELYNPTKVVRIEGYKMGDGEAQRRQALCDTAIDAEITKSYLDRKDQRELKAGNVEIENGGEGKK